MSYEENELLKLYESQYTGRLFEKANTYLLERNALFDERDELNKEIERLNNIIDELENYLEKTIIDGGTRGSMTFWYRQIYEYLKKLKEKTG